MGLVQEEKKRKGHPSQKKVIGILMLLQFLQQYRILGEITDYLDLSDRGWELRPNLWTLFA